MDMKISFWLHLFFFSCYCIGCLRLLHLYALFRKLKPESMQMTIKSNLAQSALNPAETLQVLHCNPCTDNRSSFLHLRSTHIFQILEHLLSSLIFTLSTCQEVLPMIFHSGLAEMHAPTGSQEVLATPTCSCGTRPAPSYFGL